MPRRVSFRIVAITSILIVIVSIAVKANWGSGFGFSLFRANAAEPVASMIQELSQPAAVPMTTPLNAITSFDAAVLARYIAGIGPMASPAPTEKLAAADVSGNCLITSLDPTQIGGWVTDNTAGGTTNTTINPPGPCASFPIAFPVLKGDVTGTAPVTTLGSGSATVSLPAITPTPGTVVIPVTVTDLTGLDVLSYDMQIDYDPSLMTPASPAVSTTGTLSAGASPVVNTANPGHLIVSAPFGAVLSGSGTLINLRFDVFGTPGQSGALTFADFLTSSGPGSHTHQGFLFNEGLPASTTVNGSVGVPLPPGTATNTSTSTPTATFTPTPLPGAPQITRVDRTYSGFFLEGFNADNVFDVRVNWNGSPGTVRFQINDNAPIDVPGNATGVMQAFNMSTAFPPRSTPSILKITATNGQSFTGTAWTGTVYVFKYPTWLQNAVAISPSAVSIFAENAQMKAKLDWKFPDPAADSLKVTIPSWVPFIAGELGVKQTQGVVKGQVSSLGPGELSVGGQTGFKAMESEVNGRILGTGKFLLNQNGFRLTEASLSFSLTGTLAKEVGILEAIPSLSLVARHKILKQFNDGAKLRGEIAPEVTVSGVWMQNPETGLLAFNSVTGMGQLGLKGIVKTDLGDRVKVQGWLGGSGSLTFGYPAPYLRAAVLAAEAGVEFKVDFVIRTGYKYTRTFKCQGMAGGPPPACGETFFPRGGKGVPLSKVTLRPLRQHYGRFGKYEQFGSEISRNLSSRRAQATKKPHSTVDPPFLANVFPGAQPKIIPVGSSDRMLLYVRQDPKLPTLQSTDIAWSYFDGTNWSSPAVILSDTRAEMSPVAGVDENGKVIAAWLRIKDPAFSGTVPTFDDLPNFYKYMEVVSAVFDPALGTWSAVTQLTDDLALDTGLRLSSDGAGKLMLTWQSNPSGEFLADAAHPATLKYTFWNGTAWNSVATVATGLVNINEHAADVNGTNAFIIVPHDPDTDVTGDRTLLLYDWNGASWSSSTVFAASGVDNLNPSAAYDTGGQGHVIWLRGSNIVHATLASPTPQLVRTGGDSMAFYNLQFINNPAGNMTLVRQEASDSGPAKIFAAIYDTVSQTWSDDLALNDDGDDSQASDSSGYYGTDGKLRLAYLATQINRITRTVTIDGQPVDVPNIPEDGQVDMRLLEYTLATDLTVVDDDLALSTENPQADDAMTADLTIHNTGAYPVNNFNVKLFAGDPNTGTLLDTVRVTTQMPGGSDRIINFAFKYPATELTFTAVVDSDDEVVESSETNNIAVATVTAPSPTPTPPPASLNGVVSYGNAAAPPKFISNVTVTGTGSPNVTTTTDAPGITGGEYTLTGFGSGSYTVSLSKTSGQNGITSNDAARIAQHVAGTSLFTTDNQRVSADVTGNNAISSQDAAKIAQFAAGLPFSPPNLSGQWRFYLPPGPTFPVGSSATTRTYSSVTSNLVGEDYVGLLIGETTGNWTPTAARKSGIKQSALGSGPMKEIAVELPSVARSVNKEIVVPVNVQGIADKNVISYEFDLRYDPSVIQPLGDVADVKGTISRGLSVVTNAMQPGLLRVVVYGPLPIDEDGVLLNLRFTAVGASGSVSPLTFERIVFNEGEPRVTVTDGKIELGGS